MYSARKRMKYEIVWSNRGRYIITKVNKLILMLVLLYSKYLSQLNIQICKFEANVEFPPMTNKTNGYVIVFEMKEISDGFKSHQCFDRLRGRERERDRYATRNSQNHLFFSSSYFLSAWSDFFSVSLRNRHIRFSLRYGRRQFVWIIK